VEVPAGTRTNPFWTKPHGLFLKDNFFSKLFIIRQQSSPESDYADSLKGCESRETAHVDGSNLKYPKNSLSGIGHLAKMPQIL
jgi:hypothetical protein